MDENAKPVDDAAQARLSRRERLKGRSPEAAGPAAPQRTPPPPATRPRFEYLSAGRLATLRERALALLEQRGIVVNHDGAKARLVDAGARTDGRRLRLPAGLVEAALAGLPRQVRLCGKQPANDVELPAADATFTMRTGTGAHGFLDPAADATRKLVLADVETIAAVANRLERIGMIAHPFVNGVPELTADVHGVAALLAATPKHVWLQPYGAENVDYLLRLAAVAAGGEAALAARPVVSCIVTSFTPFEFKAMDVEAIIRCGQAGVPIHACSLPTAGGTAPVTMPGVVLVATAEIMAMAVLAHVLAPGTPVIATPLVFGLDMRTGRILQSSVEAIEGAAMAVELMRRGLGLPTHSYGTGSDTPDIDGQCQTERALLGQLVALAGADMLGGVGQLECATVFSPVQAVLDDEVGAMLQRLLRTPQVDDATLAWESVLEVADGAHFLATPHTLQHCRETFAPIAFRRLGREAYEAEGRPTAAARAREICEAACREHPPGGWLDAAQRREMAAIVAAADRAIAGLG